jgi:ClpP class serine protease
MANETTTTERLAAPAGEVVDQAKEQVREVAGAAADRASGLVDEARHELRTRAQDQASNLADGLGRLADELRAMAQAPSDGVGIAHKVAEQAADQTSRVAERLRAGDLDTMLNEVRRFGRNRPGTFLLVALGSGIAVGRLLRNADLKRVAQAAQSDTSNGHPALDEPAPVETLGIGLPTEPSQAGVR